MAAVYEIAVKKIDPQPIASVRVTIALDKLADTYDQVFPEIRQYLTGQGITLAGPPLARYHRFDPDGIDLEAGLLVPAPVAAAGHIQPGELPGGQVAATWHVGPYDTLPQAYAALAAWMEEQNWAAAGAPWQVYWSDPGDMSNPQDLRTEVLWPVK